MIPLFDYINPSGEYIFTVIKPGFLDKAQDIIDIFKKAGWNVGQTIIKQLTLKEAHELYNVHKKEKWYDDLCEYMSSGPSRAIIYQRPGRITEDTFKSVEKLKDDIRERWGVDDCRNVMHSSDSMSGMEHEKSIYF